MKIERSFNPQIFPGDSSSREENQGFITLAIVLAVIAVAIGLLYWWWDAARQSPTEPVPSASNVQPHTAVESLLNDSVPMSVPVTNAPGSGVAGELSNTKPSVPSGSAHSVPSSSSRSGSSAVTSLLLQQKK